jgi:hypothetical protein
MLLLVNVKWFYRNKFTRKQGGGNTTEVVLILHLGDFSGKLRVEKRTARLNM